MRLFSILGRFAGSAGYAILLYHSIDPEEKLYSTDPALFRAQMAFLKGQGYVVSSLRPLYRHIQSGTPIPEKTVFLTFDDGLQNNYDQAYKILSAFGYTATVFLVTGKVGASTDWYHRDSKGMLPNFRILSWLEIEEMSAGGMDFQPHSHNHPFLTRLDPKTMRQEILTSKKVLEDRIQQPALVFCHPYGDANNTTESVVKECGFIGSIANEMGKFRVGDDPFKIKRMDCDKMLLTHPAEAVLAVDLCLQGTYPSFIRFKRGLAKLGLADKRFEEIDIEESMHERGFPT